MCGWRKSGFPGAQPVSLDRENLAFLSQRAYKVSWKADGTRYMMLIDGKDQTYFIDRDNCVFQVDNITFLHRKDANKHIGSTLLDGVRHAWRNHREFPIPSFIEVFRLSFREFPRLVGCYCS